MDLGTNAGDDNEDFDNAQEAINALVFLAVCVNGHWKVPLGYFLIHSLCGSERANLLTKCFELLQETSVICHSITFDGAPSNLSMCTSLGSNFDYYSPKFKPWFNNPSTSLQFNPIYVFWDASHMLKLVRNTLEDKQAIQNGKGEIIKWNYIVKLQELQESKGLHPANKLKKTHIRYFENKMNVRLAAQTLSQSVSSSLLFCEELKLLSGVKPTAEFCEIMNNVFDLLNCRNKLGKGNLLPIK